MECPKCKAPMIVLELAAVEIDYCNACHGTWLDGGELELLLESAHNRDEMMATLAKEVTGRERHLSCPICEKRMDKVRFGLAADAAVRLDKCHNDHGIWFDEGELDEALRMGRYLEGGKIYELLSDVFGRKGN